MLLRVREGSRDIDAMLVVIRAPSRRRSRRCGSPPRRAISLRSSRHCRSLCTTTAAPLGSMPMVAHLCERYQRDAAAGGFDPAPRTANLERLARHDPGNVLADVHAVRVHKPRHNLRRRADIGRRNVLIGADDLDEFGRVPPRDPLEFAADSVSGSQVTPPLPPPKGRSTTAHFHVIQKARAVTSSSVTPGWKRMPPLEGPRAKLYCTR